MDKVKAQYTVLMGDFNAKVGKKQTGVHAVGDYGMCTRNNKGERLVKFAERKNLRTTNTFFRKREKRKWTWESPNSETKNEIDFVLCAHPGIVDDVEMIGKVRWRDHRTVRSGIILNLQREHRKLVSNKAIHEFAIPGKLENFRSRSETDIPP